MCKFCDDYCFVKYYDELYKDETKNDHFENRIMAACVSVTWNKQYHRIQGRVTYEARSLKYCATCGVRFGSKEFGKYYKEWLKRNGVKR